jgi:arylsulfatase B
MLLLLALAGPAQAQAQDNVLLIIGDDLGVDRIASFAAAIANTKPAPTPGIDALGDAGVRFTRAYAQCVCSPSRTALMTGRQGFRTGIGTGIPWNTCETSPNGCFQWDPSVLTTLPQALSATHTSAAFGKWHLSGLEDGAGWQHPIDIGFDYFSGAKQNLPGAGQVGYYFWERNQADALGNSQAFVSEYATTVNVDDALGWIQEQGAHPWFAWLAFNAAHTPLHDPPASLTTLPANGTSTTRHRAMIQAMDAEILRLLLSMRRAVLQRTWVIFVGDNGNPPSTIDPFSLGVWPTASKVKPNPWEGNVRVPLVIYGPGVNQAGREVSDPVHIVDLFATVCDLAGVDVPATAVDSVSMAPHLRNPSAPREREFSYGERFKPNGFGPYTLYQWYITDGRWKLGKYSKTGNQDPSLANLFFFDLDDDIKEAKNLLNGTLNAEQQTALDALVNARAALIASEQNAAGRP